MIAYLDTSVVLCPLFGQTKVLDWSRWESAYSSEVFGLEARRVIDRLRLESALDDLGVAEAHQELARIDAFIGRVPLTRAVLRRAALPMPTLVKTLDAIHLTSALMLQEAKRCPLIFATHDRQQAIAARCLGFEVKPAHVRKNHPIRSAPPSGSECSARNAGSNNLSIAASTCAQVPSSSGFPGSAHGPSVSMQKTT